MPGLAQARFIDLRRRLAHEDIPPDERLVVEGHDLWVFATTVANVTYRMAVELMPEGFIMVWAHGGPTLFRRRLRQRLIWLE